MSNNDQNNMNSKDFLIGTLFGGIIGAVTALLLAPKTGKELRSDLNQQSSTWREKGNEYASIAMEKSSNLAKAVSEQSSQVAGKVRDLRDGVKSGQQQSSDETAQMLKDAAEEGSKEFQEEVAEAAEDEKKPNL